MSTNRLSPKQQEFVLELFGNSAGNIKSAAKKVFGTEDYSSVLTTELVEAIKSRGDKEIALNVPRAISVITKLLDDPDSAAFAMPLHKVASDILDRAGLTKQEKASTGQVAIGIILLPTKSILPPPPELIEKSTVDIPVLKNILDIK